MSGKLSPIFTATLDARSCTARRTTSALCHPCPNNHCLNKPPPKQSPLPARALPRRPFEVIVLLPVRGHACCLPRVLPQIPPTPRHAKPLSGGRPLSDKQHQATSPPKVIRVGRSCNRATCSLPPLPAQLKLRVCPPPASHLRSNNRV
jgi:hypothetical protein